MKNVYNHEWPPWAAVCKSGVQTAQKIGKSLHRKPRTRTSECNGFAQKGLQRKDVAVSPRCIAHGWGKVQSRQGADGECAKETRQWSV